MAKAVRIRGYGGVEQLEVVEVRLPDPGPGEVAIRQTAVGVNFVDVYHRTGLYPLPLPAVLGVEAAGVVSAVGADSGSLRVGDRVAYAGAPVGAYASERIIPAWRAVPLPAEVSDEAAARALAKGLTVHMLMTRTYPVERGTTVLVHAAAGGLGSMLVRWARRQGARVIGTVGSRSKAGQAREAGCDHVIVGRDADLPSEVGQLTGGQGVDVAYDGLGGTTLLRTLACVRRFGTVASIGQVSGPIPPLHLDDLGPARALSLARPSVMAYMNERETYRRAATEVLKAMAEWFAPAAGNTYPLVDVARAHADLEVGGTTGSLILVP
jgi:NADPH2:quinone reductase